MKVKVSYQGDTQELELYDLLALLQSSGMPWYYTYPEIYIQGSEKDLILKGEFIV